MVILIFSFAVVDSGKPMVIPKVSAHSAVLIGGPRGRVVEEVSCLFEIRMDRLAE